MPGHCPEDHGERDGAGCDEDGDPDGAAEEKLLDVWLADAQRPEGCGLGLAEEDEDRVQLVLVRDEEENGERIWDEELCEIANNHQQQSRTADRKSEARRTSWKIWRNTHEETLGLRLDVEEDEGEARGEPNPQDDEARNQAHERGDGGEVPERLRPEESGERILLHRAVAVLLLCVEHIRDLRHERNFGLRLRVVCAAEWERVDAQRRG